MTRVGICEDDPAVRRVLTEALKLHGHDVVIARNGREAMANLAASSGVAVLIIDIGLPDADGRDVCQALRADGQQAPVLFLTALDAVHDRVAGFNAGGDDYVAKPFAIAEVLVRIDALTRRRRPLPQTGNGLELDPSRHAVRHGDLEERLTPTEFRFLATLAAEPGVVVRRRAAVAAAWPDGAMVSENTIDSYVRRLRVKLAAIDSPRALETVRGVGFVLR
ncbi:response regulator transcription factor [Aeromicrobium fastidiosum]|uniref:Response regulator transcription factor n=1 Tax=Aeromicrobium fastidiosum TaxID=52699 RepID=A0A641AQ32_9ACTN|nr:response regulator transcription factor [Aeromicrobium fastidiosum]KAA1378821.1 response regulator transcription factor [Aeromicrobium fastidiosum]